MSIRQRVGELAFILELDRLGIPKMHKKADARLHFRMLLLSSPSPFCELNMVQTVGAMDKAPGARKSRAPADQARQRAQAAKSAGGAATISEAERFTQGGPAPTLAPAPAPETIAPVSGSSDAGDGEVAASAFGDR